MATVEVILKEKIEGLGSEADVVKVKRGFARNFLLPQGRAFEATKEIFVTWSISRKCVRSARQKSLPMQRMHPLS